MIRRLWDFFFKPSILSLERQLTEAEARLAAEEKLAERCAVVYPITYTEAMIDVSCLRIELERRKS